MSEALGEPTRYCVLFQLGKQSDMRRIAEVVPQLVDLVKQWSRGEMEQLCRSNDGQLFGYLFKSTKPAQMMQSEFASSPAADNNDSCIIIEAGDKFGGMGFSRAWAWLQHH